MKVIRRFRYESMYRESLLDYMDSRASLWKSAAIRVNHSCAVELPELAGSKSRSHGQFTKRFMLKHARTGFDQGNWLEE